MIVIRIKKEEPWIFSNTRKRYMDKETFLQLFRTKMTMLQHADRRTVLKAHPLYTGNDKPSAHHLNLAKSRLNFLHQMTIHKELIARI